MKALWKRLGRLPSIRAPSVASFGLFGNRERDRANVMRTTLLLRANGLHVIRSRNARVEGKGKDTQRHFRLQRERDSETNLSRAFA